LRLPSIS